MPQRAPPSVPKLSGRSILYIVAAGVFVFLILGHSSVGNYAGRASRWKSDFTSDGSTANNTHPIDDLVTQANRAHEALVQKASNGLSAAAEAYRARRGRHPPPDFDRWVEYAEQNGALIVEDFFDPIYDDLEPFWGIEAARIRNLASTWPNIISVRDKAVKTTRSAPGALKKLEHRSESLKSLQDRLPDVDLAISIDEQQAVVVPWNKVNLAMQKASATRSDPVPGPASIPFSDFTRLPELEPLTEGAKSEWREAWNQPISYWEMSRRGCEPGSPAHDSLQQEKDLSKPPTFAWSIPYKSYRGFVGNWTQSKSPCIHPELRNLHGALVKADVRKRHRGLFPLFADSKIQDINNVIVFPARHSFEADDSLAGSGTPAQVPWEAKKPQLVWRGDASGGQHNKRNWRRFHRHRFVAMSNGSWVASVEDEYDDGSAHSEPPVMFPLPKNDTWPLAAMETTPSLLGQWINKTVDAGFVHFMCNSGSTLAKLQAPGKCEYMQPYYVIKDEITAPAIFEWKYLADIDGDGASIKFTKFLRSDSLPVKATIFSEWYDSRLVPWKHFVPLDNTFTDLYGVMEYFVGFDGATGGGGTREGHDSVAKRIALDGQDWARRVLRPEDALVYVYRLILEYARLCDDRRDNMGYVGDLTG